MPVARIEWEGKVVSVNNWKDVRIIPRVSKAIDEIERHRRLNQFKAEIATCQNWGHAMKIVAQFFFPMVYETPAYREFKESLADVARGVEIPGFVDVRIEAWLQPLADSDGPVKPVFDALEAAKVVMKDNKIRHFRVFRRYHKRGLSDRLAIEVYKAALDREGQQPLVGIET